MSSASSAFLCHCNHIAVPAVIEGSTVLVCRHLLQGSQYRTDPHHRPCGFKLEDTGPEFQPRVRAAVLHRKPRRFQALGLPTGSNPLDLYRPKKEVATSRAQMEDAMDIDSVPLEGAQFVLDQRSELMDGRAWQRRCLILERRLKVTEDENRQMKERIMGLEEELKRKIQALEEQTRETEYYRKKHENARTELHDLRRSTRIIISSALQPQRSSPSPI
ncbi:hypothetical protein OPQ81_005667 [Rhizoctonia solani]|nr:hypothetical protein OPQ81_005667 [Rhizoctonia solani]